MDEDTIIEFIDVIGEAGFDLDDLGLDIDDLTSLEVSDMNLIIDSLEPLEDDDDEDDYDYDEDEDED